MRESSLDNTPHGARQDVPPAAGPRHFDLLASLFVAVLLISNVASSKVLSLGPFTFDGGTILFPASYIFGDILTEVYGYRKSRRVIWIGFFAALLMSLTFIVVGALPPAGDWDGQAAWDRILGLTPRIVLASLLAYWAGEFANAYVLARMKVASGGRLLWTRTIGSTLVGEGLDTLIFCTAAFAGTMPNSLLWAIIVSNYLFKVGVEVIFTPVTYLVVGRLKAAEGVDTFDAGIDFNPFSRTT